MSQVDFKKMFEGQNNAAEVDALCRRFGAGFVIDAARCYLEAKERQSYQEHQRWRAEIIKSAAGPTGEKT